MSIRKPWAILLSILGLIVVLLIAAWFSDWSFMRGPLERYLSKELGRPVTMSDFRVKLGRVTQVRVADLNVGGRTADEPPLVALERLEGGVRLWSVVQQPVIIEVLRLEGGEAHLARDAEGRGNWTLKKNADEPQTKGKVPQVRQLVLDRATVHYDDRKLDLLVNITGRTIDAQAEESASGRYGLHFAFDGNYKKGEFDGEARTAGLAGLTDANQALPMQIAVNSGTTKLFFEGTMGDVIKLDKIDARLRISGATLANLYPFLPLPLPASPQYRLNGQLQRDGKNWRLLDIDGTIGRSDMAGEASYTIQEPRPLLDVKLRSRELRFSDLGPLVGARTQDHLKKTGERVATRDEARRKQEQTSGRPGKVLPDSDFSLEKLNAMDADVQLDAGKIDMDKPFAFESLSATLKLRDGVMDLAPVRFGFAGGTLGGKIRLNAKQNPIAAWADINVERARIARLFPTNKLVAKSVGQVGANMKLESRGNSVAKLLANASGDFGLASSGGELSVLLVELAGLDAGQALGYWIGRDRPTPINCAVSTFQMQKGVAVSELLVLDTEDTMIDGEGVVNFRDESLDFTFRPHPKDPSILSARSPLHVRGTFGNPRPSVDAKALATRGGAALALGLLNPLAALIPLIEPGTGTDADCQGLLKEVGTARRNANKK